MVMWCGYKKWLYIEWLYEVIIWSGYMEWLCWVVIFRNVSLKKQKEIIHLHLEFQWTSLSERRAKAKKILLGRSLGRPGVATSPAVWLSAPAAARSTRRSESTPGRASVSTSPSTTSTTDRRLSSWLHLRAVPRTTRRIRIRIAIISSSWTIWTSGGGPRSAPEWNASIKFMWPTTDPSTSISKGSVRPSTRNDFSSSTPVAC